MQKSAQHQKLATHVLSYLVSDVHNRRFGFHLLLARATLCAVAPGMTAGLTDSRQLRRIFRVRRYTRWGSPLQLLANNGRYRSVPILCLARRPSRSADLALDGPGVRPEPTNG